VFPRECLLNAVIPLTYPAGLLAERVFRIVTELFIGLERFLVTEFDADLDADFDTDLDGLLLRVVLSPHVPFAKQEFPTPILHSCQHFL